MLGDSDDSVPALVERFSKLLSAFDSHPWTLQRLCEVLLEPQKQYKRLHKLVRTVSWYCWSLGGASWETHICWPCTQHKGARTLACSDAVLLLWCRQCQV